MRTPSPEHLSRYPGLTDLQDADTMSEGNGWGWLPVWIIALLIILGGGVAIIAGVVWFVVKAIEAFQ